MIDGMRAGFVKDSKGNSLLPITHINLIIGDDGTSIRNTFDAFDDKVNIIDGKILAIDNRLSSVQTYDDLLAMDTSTLIDGAIAYVINDKKYYSYTSGVWEIMSTGSSEEEEEEGPPNYDDDIYSHIWIGPNPPENKNMIWIDTNSDGVADSESDYRTLVALLNRVAELEVEVINLRGRLEYLEENGVVNPGHPDDPDEPDDPIYDEDDIVLLEDGTSLLLEDGTDLLLEEQIIDGPIIDNEDDIVLLEDGSELLLEDDTPLMLEVQTETPVTPPPATNEKVLMFENGTEILLENGNNLLLER